MNTQDYMSELRTTGIIKNFAYVGGLYQIMTPDGDIIHLNEGDAPAFARGALYGAKHAKNLTEDERAYISQTLNMLT